MATTIHVNAKSVWKKVDIDASIFSKEDLDGLISFEELTDYQILSSGDKKGKKGKKNKEKNTNNEKKKDETVDKKKSKKNAKESNLKQKLPKADIKKGKSGSGMLITQSGEDVEDLNTVLETESKVAPAFDKKRKKYEELDGPPKKKKKKPNIHSDSDCTQDDSDLENEESVGPNTKGMEAWKNLCVPEEILWALKDKKFYAPTPIQSMVLPSAIRDKMDILGAAETGSGKTLAFGIPVLHYILEGRKARGTENEGADSDTDNERETVEEDKDVVLPDDDANEEEKTEDAEEIDSEEEEGGDMEDDGEEQEEEGSDTLEDESEGPEDGTGCVKVIEDVDFSFLEEDAQPLMVHELKPVKTHPCALILEPTRELAIQVRNHLRAAAKYANIKVEAVVGGLAPQKQRRLLRKCPEVIVATPGRLWEMIQEGETYLSEIEKTRHLVVDEADRMIEKGHFEELSRLLLRMNKSKAKETRHTYVFSATLTMIHSGPQRMLKKKKKVKLDEKMKLDVLVSNIGLKPKPKIVDLSRKVGTVETLTEARINCTKEDKDIYLYYFLKRYPGRTLVFANSKDCIRRLMSIFNLLQCCPLPLHADMHQRQRLKNLERFTGNPRGLLIASDVAARGLDIPNVQHVIHYQVPHTVENYVHRSGRTARALKEGLSVVLVGPDDLKNYRKIIHTLNKSEDLPLFPVDQDYMSEFRRRVNMVRQIETKEYRFNKTKRQNDWFQKAAEEIGVDIEDENLLNDLGDEQAQVEHKRYIKQMKAELALMLKTPIVPVTMGGKYPTKSGKLLLPPSRDVEKSAIQKVKKDKKVQDKMLENIRNNPLPVREKKKKEKWRKKKKKKADS